MKIPPPPPSGQRGNDTDSASSERRRSSHDERMDKLASSLAKIKQINQDDKPEKIMEGLYLGSVAAANNVEWLKKEGITHVLCVADSITPRAPKDFQYLVIEIPDIPSANIRQQFEKCFQFLHDALEPSTPGALPSKVIVHCFAGRSRSATVIIAYLMATRGLKWKEAYKMVEDGRKSICPNSGFISQLEAYENEGPKWPMGNA